MIIGLLIAICVLLLTIIVRLGTITRNQATTVKAMLLIENNRDPSFKGDIYIK